MLRLTKKHSESIVLDMSDHHFGKRTSTYDVATFYERMDTLGDRLADIREYLSGYTFDELVVRMFGDMVDGQDIYPTQPHHQEITDAVDQADQWSDYMTDWLILQSRVWRAPMRVEAVCGNHGRTGKRTKETSSFDRVAYNQLADRLGGYGIVQIGMGSNPFFNMVDVKGHKLLMVHGHYFGSLSSVPRHVLRWYASHQLGGFKTVSYGHFHSFKEEAAGKIDTYAVGTIVTGDEHSLEVVGAESDPRWRLYGVSEQFHRTFSYDLYLDLDEESGAR